MILTRDGDLKYSYVLPRGMTFPTGSEAAIKFTDRASNVYTLGVYAAGSISDDLTTFSWSIPSAVLNTINAGDNFEVSVTLEDGTYKVRYGRVVRKEVSYPLLAAVAADLPNTYSDDMNQNVKNTKWIARYGEVAMTNNSPLTGNPYVMGARNKADIFGIGLSLWASAAVAWYAPLQTDNIEINVGLVKYNANTDGDLTVVFSSNATMTKFLGVRFTDPAGGNLFDPPSAGAVQIDIVYGSVSSSTGASLTTVGASVSPTPYQLTTVASSQFYGSSGATFKILFTNYAVGGGSVVKPTVKVLANLGYPYGQQWIIDRDLSAYGPGANFQTGSGYRYLGLIFNGSLATQGPMIHEWAARDLL